MIIVIDCRISKTEWIESPRQANVSSRNPVRWHRCTGHPVDVAGNRLRTAGESVFGTWSCSINTMKRGSEQVHASEFAGGLRYQPVSDVCGNPEAGSCGSSDDRTFS